MKISRTAISVDRRCWPFGAGDVDRGHRGAAVARAEIDRLGAVEGRGLRAVAVVERPGAGGADRHRSGDAHRDGMVDRREIALLHIVAGAGLADAAGDVDAEPADRVARPAAAVALQAQRLLGAEHAAAARRLDMQQEVALLAEQAEAVADFPGNLQRASAAVCAAAGATGKIAGTAASRAARVMARNRVFGMAPLTLPVRRK